MSVALKLSNLCKEKIVVEKAKEFKESVFWPVYQRTKVLLEDIILRDQGQDNDAHLSSDRKPVISFVGRRGTGKTSAMMSVHNALKSKEELKEFLSDEYTRDSSFFVLDYIDVSTMEKGEDILEIVLANMFSLFLDREQKQLSSRINGSYESRELYKMFDEIYGSLMSIKDMRGRKSDISPLSLLTQLSNSQVLKVKIEKLIEKYLQYMEGDQRGYPPTQKKFLIITLDDLDMSFQNETEFPFEILETLHRYLMTTRVIILVTYNFSDLCLGCEKHFMKIYSDKKRQLDFNEMGMVRELTQEYLKKVLPMYNRVHLPSLKKCDYIDEVRPGIEMQSDEIKELFDDLKRNILKDDTKASFILDLKKFVMLLRGSVAGLYYDANGLKKHFVEPSQLRELVQTYTFFEQLNKQKHSGENEKIDAHEPDSKNEDIIFKALLDNLYFEFAKSKLVGEEQELFESFLSVPLDRRCEDIFTTLHDKAMGKQNEASMSCILYKSGAKESYSYGELIYRLYLASKERWFTKRLIWCILDSYTIMLTKYYQKMKKTKDLKEKKKWREKILDVLGTSVASSWSNLLVPKIRKKDSDNEVLVRNRMEYGVYDGKESGEEWFAAIKFGGEFVQWDFELAKDKNSDLFKKQLHFVEFLAMFFTKVYCRTEKEGIHHGFDIKYIGFNKNITERLGSTTLDLDKSIALRFRMTDGCFNIFNFVYNLLDSENFFSQLHYNLEEAYKNYFTDIGLSNESANKFFEENSMKTIYQDWFKRTQGFALPVYSFDMIYNLFKRQYRKKGLKPDSVPIDNCWFYINECFEEFGKLLESEDKFYFSTLSEEKLNSEDIKDVRIDSDNKYFFNAYNDSPFIQMVHEIKDNKELEKYFFRQFKEMLYGMV